MKGFAIILAVITYISAVRAETCPNNNRPIPIPNNCNAFYNCSGTIPGIPVLSSCPQGQYYDCMNLKCSNTVYPACCIYDTSVNWTAMYPNPINMMTAYPCTNGAQIRNQINGACGVYFQCVNNIVLNSACNAGYSYSNISSNCSVDPTCTNPAAVVTTTTQAPTSPVYACFPSNTNSNWTSCQSFISYVNGSAINNQCPGGGYYNGFTKCCGNTSYSLNYNCWGDKNMPYTNNLTCPKAGQMVENVRYCGGYYQCVSGGSSGNYILPRFCAYNEQFDWVKKQCVAAGNATVVPGCTVTGYQTCMQNPRWLLKTRCSLMYKWIINMPNMYNNCISRGCALSFNLKLN